MKFAVPARQPHTRFFLPCPPSPRRQRQNPVVPALHSCTTSWYPTPTSWFVEVWISLVLLVNEHYFISANISWLRVLRNRWNCVSKGLLRRMSLQLSWSTNIHSILFYFFYTMYINICCGIPALLLATWPGMWPESGSEKVSSRTSSRPLNRYSEF